MSHELCLFKEYMMFKLFKKHRKRGVLSMCKGPSLCEVRLYHCMCDNYLYVAPSIDCRLSAPAQVSREGQCLHPGSCF